MNIIEFSFIVIYVLSPLGVINVASLTGFGILSNITGGK